METKIIDVTDLGSSSTPTIQIENRGIKLYNEDGLPMIAMTYNNKTGGSISVADENGKPRIYLADAKVGSRSPRGEITSLLGDDKGRGVIVLRGRNGNISFEKGL